VSLRPRGLILVCLPFISFSLLEADSSLGDLLWDQFPDGSDRRWSKSLYDGDGMD
jgi:hypothetical protein